MSEQLHLFNVPAQPVGLHLKPHQTASPETISGPDGDVIIYNVKNDFINLSAAHKDSFVPKTKVGSAYIDLVPDIEDLPKPDGQALDSQKREQIIREGNIPEVMPFMAGARIALAERRAKRQHQKAQSPLRRIDHVALHVAENVVEGTDYSAPENQFRPRTLREKAMAQRMGRLVRRANHHNSSANIVEDMYTDPDGRVDFDEHKDNLSIFEKLHRKSARKLHDRRREQSSRVMRGYRIPVVDKRIGLFSFDSLAAGGPGSPVKALEKRDNAIRLAEALEKAKTAQREIRLERMEAIRLRHYLAKRALVRARQRSAELITNTASKAVETGRKRARWTADKYIEVGAFTTALVTEELPVVRDNIEAADWAYEKSAEKGFVKRARHEARMYAMNVGEAGKAVKRAWQKRK